MLVLFFEGQLHGLQKGIDILSHDYCFSITTEGLPVRVEKIPENKIEVVGRNGAVVIRYHEKIHFFRALGLLIDGLSEGTDFEIYEEPQFTMDGIMLDMSQSNAVIKTEYVKKIIRIMAIMGLNMMMLYTEDNFEVEGEPYFGYMRGRYSYSDVKEIDDYADIFGIEVIPSIQTLAHLSEVLKWYCYDDLRDDPHTMLVGYERTYEFIEKMIRAATAPLRTKRIHIGMDEAMELGLGRYARINGLRNRFDIMTEHLDRVLQTTSKYGLKPMIWSDMYFRAASKDDGYDAYYDMEAVIPHEVIERFPKGVNMVYWDYENEDENFCREWLKRHRAFGSDPIFAGGIWCYGGFGVNYQKTFRTTNISLKICKEQEIKEVFLTIWGDATAESNIFSNLLGMQLYAEHGYSEKLDAEKLKKRFKVCTGCNYDDFMEIEYLNTIPGALYKDEAGTRSYPVNSSKYLMWQDILIGLFDKHLEGFDTTMHFERLKNRMEQAENSNGEFGFVFKYLKKACAVLVYKANIGLRISSAYMSENMDELRNISEKILPELSEKVLELRDYHRELWCDINQPFGWEIMDYRYGGLLLRIDSAVKRINDFLSGRIKNIEELERERLHIANTPGLIYYNDYVRMISASRL